MDSVTKTLGRSFFERDPLTCARNLIGCTLGFGTALGIIVETEAYAAEGDPACHTWKRQAARDFVSRNPPGTAYVYLNYGMHWLFNMLVKDGSMAGFVLIRALEPVGGITAMKRRRGIHSCANLCNGPAKLAQALGITGKLHGRDPILEKGWTLLHPVGPVEIDVSTRVGISLAVDYPWRFTLKGSPFVSRPV